MKYKVGFAAIVNFLAVAGILLVQGAPIVGSAIVYGSITDTKTNDPSYQSSRRIC